jgi:thiamine-phosphate pyrophosphorylase
MHGFYFITDAGLSRAGNLADVQSALAAGVSVVQYREKQANSLRLFEEARRLRAVCREALFLVNDRVDVALAVEADGVHLGQQDLPCPVARLLLGPHKIIGITVSSLAEARRAIREGADYLGVSPVFATGTKTDAGAPVGIQLLAAIREESAIPLVAIGGITLDNAPRVIAAGADGLCAISAVVSQADVAGEIAKFQNLFRARRGLSRGPGVPRFPSGREDQAP